MTTVSIFIDPDNYFPDYNAINLSVDFPIDVNTLYISRYIKQDDGSCPTKPNFSEDVMHLPLIHSVASFIQEVNQNDSTPDDLNNLSVKYYGILVLKNFRKRHFLEEYT